MEHVFEKHENCQRAHCEICDGGLARCTVCGGMEGSLLPECPGRWLSVKEDEENYKKFLAGEPPFGPRHAK